MAAPVLLLVALFTLYPVGRALYQSTRIESPIFPSRYVGLRELPRRARRSLLPGGRRELRSGSPWPSVPLLIVLGVLVALLLNEPFIGNTVAARRHAPALGPAGDGRRADLEVDLPR